MTVTYNKLIAENGFKTDNFEIGTNGNLVLNSIDVQEIKLDGEVLFSVNQETPQSDTLPSNIIYSSLTSVGTLVGLTVHGNVTLSNGTISIDSTGTGHINNVNIGNTIKGTGAFTTLSATSDINFTTTGAIVINPSVLGSINNVTIGSDTATTGRFTSVTLTQDATEDSQVPRKQYVDRILTAFAIAFGT